MQAIEVNVDEDTLVKLVAFVRTSLAPPVNTPSTLVYFERFEVHPIKVSFSSRAYSFSRATCQF